MENVSFKITEEEKNKIISFYNDYQIENNGMYIVFFAKYETITITIYQSKKGYKVVFNGKNALKEAQIFNKNAEIIIPKETKQIEYETFESQIGSDEVGFGDFFGPLIVVAAYFDKDNQEIEFIKDSKKLTDSFIMQYVPTIINKVKFSKLTVHNEKYNSLINKGYNMNQIKAILHNTALVNLSKKIPTCKNFFIDQFCNESTYFSYIIDQKERLFDIKFSTKGEQHFPSVALASMIARYCFLLEMDNLSKKYNMTFPKGANITTDAFAQEFIKKYSLEELKKVCKTNFSNYQNLIKDSHQEPKLF